MIESLPVVFINTDGVFLLLAFALGYFWFVEKNRSYAIKMMISSVAVFAVVVALKELFLEPRPFVMSGDVAFAGMTPLSSFPSFHAALAFSTATSVSFKKKRLGILLFVIAALLAFGRVAANVHYPIDVLVGIMIGILISAFVEGLDI